MIRKKYKLIPITPLHIGSKEGVLTKLSFEIIGGRCYVINEDKLAEELLRLNLIEEFSERVKDRNFSIMNFFEAKTGKNKARDLIIKCSAYYSLCTSNSSQLKPFIRDPFFRPYVPGSSIKGAIRNAIYYKILKDSETARKELENYIIKNLRTRRPRNFSNNFHLLDHFNLLNQRQNPHTDILKALRVRDSSPLPKNSLNARRIKILNMTRPVNMLIETLEQEATFEIVVDEGILENFLAENRDVYGFPAEKIVEMVKNPFEITREFMKDFYSYQKDFKKYLPTPPSDIRIGWGGGLMGITVDMVLSPGILENLRKRFYFKKSSPYNFPKTRRVVEVDNREFLVGLCEIKEIQEKR